MGNSAASGSLSSSRSVGEPPGKMKDLLRIKIITMGDAGCGKSCLVKRYCEERFVSKYISTIGIDYGVKPAKVAGKDVRLVCLYIYHHHHHHCHFTSCCLLLADPLFMHSSDGPPFGQGKFLGYERKRGLL